MSTHETDKKRALETVDQKEPRAAGEDDAPEESPEGEIIGDGSKGALVGGFIGGAAGAAVGGVFGLVGGALRDGEKKRSRW